MIKKLLIMEKALELFAKQGIDATSVQQITEHCGISKGAFYLSFKSKEELILSIIDHFMKQFITEIDYSVKGTKNEDLLLTFYSTIFHSFHKHSDVAKILFKEQTQTFSNELLIRIRYFDSLTDKAILEMVERLYGEEIELTKYDLVYCIKGLMNVYSSLLLFNNVPLDIEALSNSLAEKTNLLAKHAKLPFLTKEHTEFCPQTKITKEKLLNLLDEKISEIDDKIERESLVLLKQELLEPSLGCAIVKGLLENIRNHPDCKWVRYLLANYFSIEKNH